MGSRIYPISHIYVHEVISMFIFSKPIKKFNYSTNNYIYDTSCHVNYKGHLLHVKLSKLFI